MTDLKFHRLSAGDYGVSCGDTFLGRVVRYGNEWDCWKGHEGLLHTQHHKTRREAAKSLLDVSIYVTDEGKLLYL
jgi:hypothetical protein